MPSRAQHGQSTPEMDDLKCVSMLNLVTVSKNTELQEHTKKDLAVSNRHFSTGHFISRECLIRCNYTEKPTFFSNRIVYKGLHIRHSSHSAKVHADADTPISSRDREKQPQMVAKYEHTD